jgi:GAF domain-containing protein
MPYRSFHARDDVDLGRSLDELSRLILDSASDGLEDLLRNVARFAVQAISGADGAGLTLLEDDRPDTIVASAEFVVEADAIQYGLGQGPCISAAREGRTVLSGSLGDDARWPAFGPLVADLDIHSVLSLPLMGPRGALGAMNIYAHGVDAFDQRSVELGELFAVPAAVSVLNAQVLAQTGRLTVQLREALSRRTIIDQALGIIMSRRGCDSDRALDELIGMSHQRSEQLGTVAQTVIDAAVARVRPGPGRV